MADSFGASKNGIPWQQIANWLFAALIGVGAYVWNQTVADLHTEQVTNAKQTESIIRLDERTKTQRETTDLLRQQLSEMDKKIDRLLEMRVEPRASVRGTVFDK